MLTTISQGKILYFSPMYAHLEYLVYHKIFIALERLMEFWDRRATMDHVIVQPGFENNNA